ncbi:HAMP domain-containing sensor histidine kinase [Nocardioides sp.]|uniref:sensor histidine kinase n=1 Tax=Nocardioides sp. TaxID=35761 RepID=UPI00286E43A1|nr:HAMP domain-containing sensor histidine kinase [Nocardioides sp.]
MRSETPIHRSLFVPWMVFSLACVGLMTRLPGEETIPYHLGWVALGVAYGLNPWPIRWAIGAVVGYAVGSGLVLMGRAVDGTIALEETAEIPLMCVLAILMIWHVSRRQSALADLDLVRRQEATRAHRREHMARLVSHEIKTTLTIASGYLDLVMAKPRASEDRADLEVARDELHRLSRASDRLLRMMRMQEEHAVALVDIDSLMRQTMERWSTVAERTWLFDTRIGWAHTAPHRLRACLDTLIENSLRHTPPDGTIRLIGFHLGDHTCLGVADSGPGLTRDKARAINEESLQLTDVDADERQHSEAGLGLSIVQEVARERGGHLVAGRSAEGGALLLMVLPREELHTLAQPSRPREVRRTDTLTAAAPGGRSATGG